MFVEHIDEGIDADPQQHTLLLHLDFLIPQLLIIDDLTIAQHLPRLKQDLKLVGFGGCFDEAFGVGDGDAIVVVEGDNHPPEHLTRVDEVHPRDGVAHAVDVAAGQKKTARQVARQAGCRLLRYHLQRGRLQDELGEVLRLARHVQRQERQVVVFRDRQDPAGLAGLRGFGELVHVRIEQGLVD